MRRKSTVTAGLRINPSSTIAASTMSRVRMFLLACRQCRMTGPTSTLTDGATARRVARSSPITRLAKPRSR